MNNIASSLPGGAVVTSKFVVIYSKLFQGMSPRQINPQQDRDRFFSDLLDLKVNSAYLQGELDKSSKDLCLGKLKASLIFNLLHGAVKLLTVDIGI